MKTKVCKTCMKELTIDNFYPKKRGKYIGHTSSCKKCYCKNSWLNKKDSMSKSQKKYDSKIRLTALQAYSDKEPKCSCCGEKTIEFLGIDHIYGGGNKHRKLLKSKGTTLYLWLKKNNYPKGYQVLCHNCNLAKGYYGECPHKRSNV